ncbi:hypothetical protein EU803_04960 [Loktanella sp. IMCC34160]|uniref:hypothetical protein n=1 Tax=Loktanella sp. IMCC34160 TaxID=2510646 RepID=UPI00101D30FB|nr:hypothetical protein [Loktanella sp. IMCC34160]RYG91812.1 hypothetical protein EU803_04960 [Loktanella sp. IMCC34160]
MPKGGTCTDRSQRRSSAQTNDTRDWEADAFADWRIERIASYERDVQEGRGHSGRSALVDFVARKP